MASIAIEDILPLESPDVLVRWFYCDYTNQDSMETTEKSLAAILRLMLRRRKSLPDLLHDLHEKEQKPRLEDLVKLMASLTTPSNKVFLVIDAIDEYPNGRREAFLFALTAIAPTHLMITGREHIHVDTVISDLCRIHVHARKDDLVVFTHSRLSKFRLASAIHSVMGSTEDIADAVIANSTSLQAQFILGRSYS